MKQAVRFLGLTLILVVGSAWLTGRLVPVPEVTRAVWTSAVVALAVQAAGYGIFRAVQPGAGFLAAWGAGAGLRMLALAVYALLVVPMAKLALAPALVSLASFLFVTTLIEPLFLKP